MNRNDITHPTTHVELQGDSAVTFRIADQPSPELIERAARLAAALRSAALPGVVDAWAVYAAVTIAYNVELIEHCDGAIVSHLKNWIASTYAQIEIAPPPEPRIIDIPVHYGGVFGPDLIKVAQRANLTPQAAVELHTSAIYYAGAVGFLPGFAFLLGLPEILHTPRLPTPRTRVPAGSVGIGGAQTGVYPLISPGGWNLIGRTDLPLFNASASPPALLQVGDRVRFRAVGIEI